MTAQPGRGRPRLLLFSEAVTLAHIARPYALGAELSARGFEVHLARDARYDSLLGDALPQRHTISSISPESFTAALARGAPLYDLHTLQRYVEDDLDVITRVRPDAIMGDFRLSLAVSAAVARVPYLALANAYWSPYCRQRYPVPELPFVRLLGPTLGQALFTVARPLAFALHCLPMHRLRRQYGLPSLGADLDRVYTHADYTLYADAPDLFTMRDLPGNHRFIGPVSWSPQVAPPAWWNDLPRDEPCIYVTLGSSGRADLLPTVCAALGEVAATAIVSTAGAPVPATLPGNVHAAPYLPGAAAVARADLVLCNGGSPTTQQALLAGVPVLGVAGNLDQYLNMSAVERAGAGRLLRSGTLERDGLAAALRALLGDAQCRAAAGRLADAWRAYDPATACIGALDEALGCRPEPGTAPGIEVYR